jgi:outer membrane biosynthesis protein TonB
VACISFKTAFSVLKSQEKIGSLSMRSIVSKVCLLFFVIILYSDLNGQDLGFQEPKLLNAPKVKTPGGAKKTGVGGKVNVRVTIDESGRVVSVDEVVGPGAVCRSVQRNDVVAIRKASTEAALKTKFSPAMANGSPLISSSWVEFDFPVRRTEKSSEGLKYFTGSPGADSKGILNFKAIALPKPPYPPAARAVRVTGAVEIQVLIDEDGSIFSAEAVTGHPLLRAVSTTAACGAKFSPTLLDGNPVKVSGRIVYNFVP